jgi:hypothetical protein
MACALPARVAERLCLRLFRAYFAGMATPGVPASLLLFVAGMGARTKGRFARAAEKLGSAAAAVVEELAAEDCLAVAFVRAAQAEALLCHCLSPTLSGAEKEEAFETVMSVLLPQCVATLTRRKEAGTLLPGSCRAPEVAWIRASSERDLLEGGSAVEFAQASAAASAPELGFDVYMVAAKVALDLMVIWAPYGMSRELQLSHATWRARSLPLRWI